MRAKLTKRQIDVLAPSTKTRTVWDTDLKGFGLRISPGGTKAYVVKYRYRNKQHWHTIGKHGRGWTADLARKEVTRIFGEIAQGHNPLAKNARWGRSPTVSDTLDRYLEEHVAIHNKKRTREEVNRIVRTKIRPTFGHLKVVEVTKSEIQSWHLTMQLTPREANHALAVLSKCMSLCANIWGYIQSNPCLGLPRFRENSRDRFFDASELKRLGAAIRQSRNENLIGPKELTVVELLALTGCRRSEILGLTWQEVDLDSGFLRLRDAKTGDRLVPLGQPAIDLLKDMRRPLSPDEIVIQRNAGGEPVSPNTLYKAWKRLCNLARLEDANLHDLRHTTGTIGGQSGANAFEVRDLLGHRGIAMTARYVGRGTQESRRLADSVSRRIFEAMGHIE